MARRVGDPATLAFVLSDAHLATWDPDSPERALPWASEIYALAERVGNVELAMAAHSWRISLLLERGELAVADHEIETFGEAATRLHQQRGQAQSLLHRCARGLIAGDFAEAERMLGEAAEYAGLLQQDQILAMRLAALAFVMREVQGRVGELEGAVRQFADAQPEMPVWRCALLCVYLQTGRDAELRRDYERFAAEGFGTLGRDNLWLPALSFLAQACAHVGDPVGAAELRALLSPYSGRNVVTPDVAYIGPVDRYLALVAAAEGDLEGAVALFASARKLAQVMGAKPTLAILALEEAEAVAESDPARAAALAAEALAGAEALGLEGLADRARPLAGAEEAGAAASEEPAPAVPHSLRRRGDVWEVAGGGREFHLKDAKGVRHLALLLSYPGREFHALELVGGPGPGAAAAGGVSGELEIRARGGDDAGPLLDAHAKAEYRQRVSDLQEELEEAETFNDPERASRARAELDFISSELSAAVGLGGRDRRAAASAERARVNVTRSLRGTVDRIAEYDPALGHHLSTCIRTGTFCVYDPGPGGYAWEIESTS